MLIILNQLLSAPTELKQGDLWYWKEGFITGIGPVQEPLYLDRIWKERDTYQLRQGQDLVGGQGSLFREPEGAGQIRPYWQLKEIRAHCQLHEEAEI